MIALIIEHLVTYAHYYSFGLGAGCAGWAGWLVRKRPDEKDGD